MAADRDDPAHSNAGAELARYYDLDLAGHDDDIALYLALTGRRRHTVLELACGTGRIAAPLAAAGHDVTGVDRDQAMLDRARRRWQAAKGEHDGANDGVLTLVEGDVTTLDLGRRFDLVIVGLNTLAQLGGRDAQLAALRVAAAHLEPDGRAVVDVWLPTPTDLAAYDGSLELAWQRTDPETGDHVAKLWSAQYDPGGATAEVTTFFDTWPAGGGPVRRVGRSDELHLIGATELIALAERAGLRVDTAAGDYSMAPIGTGGERVILVCSLL